MSTLLGSIRQQERPGSMTHRVVEAAQGTASWNPWSMYSTAGRAGRGRFVAGATSTMVGGSARSLFLTMAWAREQPPSSALQVQSWNWRIEAAMHRRDSGGFRLKMVQTPFCLKLVQVVACRVVHAWCGTIWLKPVPGLKAIPTGMVARTGIWLGLSPHV